MKSPFDGEISASDKGLAQITRDDMCDVIRISEKKIFSRIAFMYAGRMVCGIHKDCAMFCVGKSLGAAAKALEDLGEMIFTGGKISGLIDVTDNAFVDDNRRVLWMGMALRHAHSLPPKS